MDAVDIARRFGGVARLYGDDGLNRLQAAHVVVIGIGGVGSWVAEALARQGVGQMTLIDLDNIAESNVNRQIHALEGQFGQAKVTAMAERIKHINPLIHVNEIEDFIEPENIEAMIKPLNADVIVDCIDAVKAKISLAVFCHKSKIPLLISGGAGGRIDPTRIKVADIVHVNGDKMLAKIRHQLRKEHGFAKMQAQNKKPAKFHLTCVYSDEVVMKPSQACDSDTLAAINGLNCAGYGSSVCVTAPFGFTLASLAVQLLLNKRASFV